MWASGLCGLKIRLICASPRIAANEGGMTPEVRARQAIDALLMQAGWQVCNMGDADIHAARGIALREFPLDTGFGFSDYLLYVLCLCD